MLRASPALNAQLPPTAAALLKFQQNPNVISGIDALINTASWLVHTVFTAGDLSASRGVPRASKKGTVHQTPSRSRHSNA